MIKENITKKTKIVCTIGPASQDMDMLKTLIKNGMNVMRMNLSHGDYEEHGAKLVKARELEKEGIYIPVMLDTKGPEIRCHKMKDGKIKIEDGSTVRISMKEVLGTPEKISVNYANLYNDAKVGNHIKIDDGKLDMVIIDKDAEKEEIVCKALNTHIISDKKGVNCTGSGARTTNKFISEQDERDLIWGCQIGVDFVAASFVRNANDVLDVRKILQAHHHPEIKIISKIENCQAMDCLDEIIDASDGIMVARGDLGVEIPDEEVPIVQRKLIEKCRAKGKPVITATQMLDSMTHSPIPTRAEVGDVSTAILESTDCVMLSGESANGDYPDRAVETQCRIARTMEQELDYEKLAQEAYDTSNKDNNDAIANAIANTAKLIGAKLIVSYTETGRSSRRISKARPSCPILSISNKLTTVRQNALYWGVYSCLIESAYMPSLIEDMEVVAIVKAKEYGLKPGDYIVVGGGTPTGSGRTNFMRIVQIPEDRDIL